MELYQDNVVPSQYLPEMVNPEKDQAKSNRTTNQTLYYPKIIGFAFTGLTDVPTSYAGQAGLFLKVNAGETGLEFGAAGGATTFIQLTDVPASYAGQGGKFVKVNAGATALEFATGGGGAAIVPVTLVVAASDSLDTSRADYVCDGTDDQDTIMTALGDLPAGGGCVKLLEGTYNISAYGIWLDDYQSLIGCGSNTILRAVDSMAGDSPIIQNYGSILSEGGVPSVYNTGIIIADLTVDGNKANNVVYSTPGMQFDCLTFSVVRNCWIKNSSNAGALYPGDGIGIGHFCDELEISGNAILNCEKDGISCYSGISGIGKSHIVITNNIIEGCLNGVHIDCTFAVIEDEFWQYSAYSDGQSILNNRCKNNTNAGILVEGNVTREAGHILIGGNQCYANVIGISLDDDITFCTVSGNDCDANTGDGIFSSGYSNIIKGNTIVHNHMHGIHIKYGIDTCVLGNLVVDNNRDEGAYDGIFLEGVEGANVQNNKVGADPYGSHHTYGIEVDVNCYFCLVTNNDLYYSGATDFLDSGTDTMTTAGNRMSPP
jgi:parallel beta-helix repeat protein